MKQITSVTLFQFLAYKALYFHEELQLHIFIGLAACSKLVTLFSSSTCRSHCTISAYASTTLLSYNSFAKVNSD